LVVLCETNVLNLISQRLDTIYQIKPKHATVLFFTSFRGTKHTLMWNRHGSQKQFGHRHVRGVLQSSRSRTVGVQQILVQVPLGPSLPPPACKAEQQAAILCWAMFNWACLDFRIHPKFYYAKRRFPITSKYRQMHEVLNVDEIIN
jgi:hypothetical protein